MSDAPVTLVLLAALLASPLGAAIGRRRRRWGAAAGALLAAAGIWGALASPAWAALGLALGAVSGGVGLGAPGRTRRAFGWAPGFGIEGGGRFGAPGLGLGGIRQDGRGAGSAAGRW